MTPVKTQQRYKCDFCNRKGGKVAIERHEPRCFKNPNRFCDTCGNKGVIEKYGEIGSGYRWGMNCPYCEKYAEYLESLTPPDELTDAEVDEINAALDPAFTADFVAFVAKAGVELPTK